MEDKTIQTAVSALALQDPECTVEQHELDAELDADRVISGVSGPAMLVRYYLAGQSDD